MQIIILCKDDHLLQALVAGPNSRRRIGWDIASIAVVSYDVLTVPLVAFKGMDSELFKTIGLGTTVFWTADIPFTFLSGYHAGGVVEMRPPKIAKAYLKSWFWVDILIVLLDWLLLFLASGVADLIGIMRISKTIRLTRILRIRVR